MRVLIETDSLLNASPATVSRCGIVYMVSLFCRELAGLICNARMHTQSPEELDFPSTMTNLRTGTWILSGTGVMHNGDTIRENYARSLDTLKVCVCVCV